MQRYLQNPERNKQRVFDVVLLARADEERKEGGDTFRRNSLKGRVRDSSTCRWSGDLDLFGHV